MNCDYSSLKNAYGAKKEPYKFELHVTYDPASGSTIPGPAAAAVVKEKFEMIPKPLKKWTDFRSFGNVVSDSAKPTFNVLVKSLPPSAMVNLASSSNIFNFRDGPFNSETQYNNPIYLGPINIQKRDMNSTFYFSTAQNPSLHTAGSIGYFDPDLWADDRDKKYFDYKLILVDKNGNIKTNKKTDANDTVYIKLDNRQSWKSKDKIGLLYLVNVKPNAAIPQITSLSYFDQIPVNPNLAVTRSLISFTS
jgi:hypothetical protein